MAGKVELLLGLVVLILVAALVFPLVNAQVTNLTDDGAGNTNYVGASAAPIVSMIPIF